MAISERALKEGRAATEAKACETPERVEVSQRNRRSLLWCPILLALAGLNCLFQIAWFWRYTRHNINVDAISYIGIARHLADRDFHASLHGYWSPLISWCITGASAFSNDFLLAGRIVTIASFLLCLPLLYLLTLRLWSSSALAALSVLCFSLSRGVAELSVSFIGADFLLTAAVLSYFILLLKCLRNPGPIHWLILGTAHAAAFLAKAFAMPLLAVSTLLAAIVAGRRNPRQTFVSAIAGMAVPLLVWGCWGCLLKTKYGQFTAGYQARFNLLDPEVKKFSARGDLAVLNNTDNNFDRYMVSDSMYPGSPLWNARPHPTKLVPQLLQKELHNLPEAFKQIIILLTPGGVLAFLLALRYLDWRERRAEAALAWIAALTSTMLIGGYCMLVFDARYLLPLVPVLFAFAVPFFFSSFPIPGNRSLRMLAGALFTGSVIFFLFYWASPFRTLHRDYQTSLYSTASALRQIPSCNRLVAIGKGPFPEHGVGWEAGIYASYFAQCRAIAFSEEIPPAEETQAVLADIQTLQPDSILLFGKPQDRDYALLLQAIHAQVLYSTSESLRDPEIGEIGQLLFSKP